MPALKKIMIVSGMLLTLTACAPKEPLNQNTATPGPDIANPYEMGTDSYAGFEFAKRVGGKCALGKADYDKGCEEYFKLAK